MDKKRLKGPSFPPPFEPIVHNFPRLNIPSFLSFAHCCLERRRVQTDACTEDVCTEICGYLRGKGRAFISFYQNFFSVDILELSLQNFLIHNLLKKTLPPCLSPFCFATQDMQQTRNPLSRTHSQSGLIPVAPLTSKFRQLGGKFVAIFSPPPPRSSFYLLLYCTPVPKQGVNGPFLVSSSQGTKNRPPYF